jgi:hypothetical protein
MYLRKFAVLICLSFLAAYPSWATSSTYRLSKNWLPLVKEVLCREFPEGLSFPSPSLVLAIIQVESGGNPNAYNHPSTGLMQVNATRRNGSKAKLLDPYYNILIGIRMLKENFEILGNEAKAIMAYNLGIGNLLAGKGTRTGKMYLGKILKEKGEGDERDCSYSTSPGSDSYLGSTDPGIGIPPGGVLGLGGGTPSGDRLEGREMSPVPEGLRPSKGVRGNLGRPILGLPQGEGGEVK